ncbi:condensin complex subunit 3-like isoform X2 [Coccinella septempunctata]|nr:condensin complex subunit 3-like isoform X2 [Coccinella septempunctata]
MFKILIEHDRFAKVRRLCVSKVALRKDVIPILLSKLRDVDIAVRLAAFNRLTKIPRSLKIEQRRLVLLSASLDTSGKVTSYVESTMLPAWLQHFDDNFHTFMKAIRLDANESDVKTTNTICEFILRTLFKSKPLDILIRMVGINENKLIPYENLNWETSNYWRILVQYIKNTLNLEDKIEDILPELVHFCKYIEGFCNDLPEVKSTTDFLENQFILKQLFTITKQYDVSDPSGRYALLHLVRYVLSEVVLTLDTAEVIIKNLEPIFAKVELRARYINELISEIIYPDTGEEGIKMEMEFDDRLKTLKSDLATTLRMQESAIAEKDYLLAESLEKRLGDINNLVENLVKEKDSTLNQEAAVKKTDIATLIKCLDIAAGLLLSPEVTKMTSSLETLKRDTIFELMIHENETVQAKAMHCYGLLCIIDKKTARDGIHLFYAPISAYQTGQECDIQILLVCIKATVDLLRVFGTQLIAAPEERTDLSESQREDHQRHFFGGTSLTNIIKGLVDLMDDEQIQVQETAGRGLCSLVLSNIVQSSSLLSRLVLKWCNPYDQSQKLKQLIGVTLQQLPRISGFHRQWEGTILITLKAIIYAPDDSPYSDTNVDDIAKFLIALFEVNLEDERVLFNFAMRVCLEIRKKPKAKQVPTLTKVLNMLNLNNENPIIDDLLATCDELRELIHNHSTITQISKFMGKLNQIKKYETPRATSPISADESGDDSEEVQVQCNGVPTIFEEE